MKKIGNTVPGLQDSNSKQVPDLGDVSLCPRKTSPFDTKGTNRGELSSWVNHQPLWRTRRGRYPSRGEGWKGGIYGRDRGGRGETSGVDWNEGQ